MTMNSIVPGLYCKWLIRSISSSMLISFLNLHVMPTSEQCDYDGLIVYEGNDTTATNRHGENYSGQLMMLNRCKSKGVCLINKILFPCND